MKGLPRRPASVAFCRAASRKRSSRRANQLHAIGDIEGPGSGWFGALQPGQRDLLPLAKPVGDLEGPSPEFVSPK